MKSLSFFGRILVTSALCLALATPVLAAEAAKTTDPAKAPAAKQAAPAPAAKDKAAAPAAAEKPAASAPKKAAAPAPKKAAAPAAPKAAPAKKGPVAVAKPAAPADQKAPASNAPVNGGSSDPVQNKLDEFAKTTITSLNRCVVPSAGKKAVTQNSDGSFTARYIAIDPNSIRTSYKKPDKAGPVTYIGYMNYTESEYQCTAASKAAAENGPFTPKNSKMLTELIKYLNGKWTY